MHPETINTIKATVPVLQAHGEQLTRLFYQRMFENNPEVRVFFNQAHQQAGSQQKALAGAICAYAENIDDPTALVAAVELIAQKHASLGIQPEHYPIVGQNLLGAIKELLGDAATDDIINAWAEAYQVLADIFIKREAEIYRHHEQHHGWQGFKPFTVVKREANSAIISSFYLQPLDNQPLSPHQAGQYISVRVPAGKNAESMRNYSLSNKPGEDFYRISVKRETAVQDDAPNGLVSNFLHDQIDTGDTIWVGPPCGEFTIRTPTGSPMVMIAGGVGITPLLSMLHASLEEYDKAPVTLIQTAVNGEKLAFADEIATLKAHHEHFDWHIRYSDPTDNDRYLGRFHSEGWIDEALLTTLDKSADFYLCGPSGMMQHCYQLLTKSGVAREQIHLEAFGPALQLAG